MKVIDQQDLAIGQSETVFLAYFFQESYFDQGEVSLYAGQCQL
ncbi:MAG: hypothetical protein ACLRWQ_08950 [Flavonifractor plautii]